MFEEDGLGFEVDGEPGRGMKAVGTWTCPECGHKSKITPRIEASGRLRCVCGEEVEIQGTGLRDTQRAFDELDRSVKDLEKIFKGFGR